MRPANRQALLLIIGSSLLLGWLSTSVALADDYTAKLEYLIAIRQRVLVKTVHIPFAQEWRPVVTFHVPPDIHPAKTYGFGARYDPATGSFIFNPKYCAALNRLVDERPDSLAGYFAREDDFRATIDHELGHAIAYDRAAAIGQLTWYVDAAANGLTAADQIAIAILTEGVGSYFEHLTDCQRRDEGFLSLPHGWSDPLWTNIDEVLYRGGNWIVFPILDRYGQRGLDYLLSHPLLLEDGNADDSGLAYQAAALKALANE